MALREAQVGAQYLHLSADEAVGYPFAAVDVGSVHDDGVLDLGVGYADVVSDAGVGAYVGVWAYLAVLADYDWSADRGSAVDYCAFADSDEIWLRSWKGLNPTFAGSSPRLCAYSRRRFSETLHGALVGWEALEPALGSGVLHSLRAEAVDYLP